MRLLSTLLLLTFLAWNTPTHAQKAGHPKPCRVEVITELGNMVIELYDATPLHRDNFIKLVESGYYDSLMFHRVISGFMAQGGDPNSKNAKPNQPLGMGGPGYDVPAEFVDSLVHVKGALAAARNNNPQKKSSGSQFYIVQGRPMNEDALNRFEAMKEFRYGKAQRDAYLKYGGTPQLDREYTVFGRVVQGLEIIDLICSQPTQPGDRPVKDIRMKMRVIQ